MGVLDHRSLRVASKYTNAPKRGARNELRLGVSSCKSGFMNTFHPWRLLLVTLAGGCGHRLWHQAAERVHHLSH